MPKQRGCPPKTTTTPVPPPPPTTTPKTLPPPPTTSIFFPNASDYFDNQNKSHYKLYYVCNHHHNNDLPSHVYSDHNQLNSSHDPHNYYEDHFVHGHDYMPSDDHFDRPGDHLHDLGNHADNHHVPGYFDSHDYQVHTSHYSSHPNPNNHLSCNDDLPRFYDDQPACRASHAFAAAWIPSANTPRCLNPSPTSPCCLNPSPTSPRCLNPTRLSGTAAPCSDNNAYCPYPNFSYRQSPHDPVAAGASVESPPPVTPATPVVTSPPISEAPEGQPEVSAPITPPVPASPIVTSPPISEAPEGQPEVSASVTPPAPIVPTTSGVPSASISPNSSITPNSPIPFTGAASSHQPTIAIVVGLAALMALV
ncbi:MAG: hypothetical protein Q9220_000843 [cf. Caloplaca sp. 1 TL-2023]